MGKSTISMAIFNSYVKLPEGILIEYIIFDILGHKSWTCLETTNILGDIPSSKPTCSGNPWETPVGN
jgi:hypothetical protein